MAIKKVKIAGTQTYRVVRVAPKPRKTSSRGKKR